MRRAEFHSREVIEADRAEFLRMLRQPIDRGAGTFGEDGYRPPMQAEACLSCGADLYGGELPVCAVCGMETPWRQEYGRILDFERRAPRFGDRARAVRETFGISPTTYELRLARMVEDPRALTVDAVTVRRLIRRRDQISAARVSEPAARRARPDPRQRPLSFPSRPGNQSPASVPTSSQRATTGEVPTESRATHSNADTPASSEVAAAGGIFFPKATGKDASGAPAGAGSQPQAAGDTSEGVRARVENDRVWGRRGRLLFGPRPLGEQLRGLAKVLRERWRGIC